MSCLAQGRCPAAVAVSECEVLLTEYDTEVATRPLQERIFRASLCSAGMAKVAAYMVATLWDACTNIDKCVCMDAVHRAMKTLRYCAYGAPEWETLRCIAHLHCAPRFPNRYTPPDMPSKCQLLTHNPTIAHEQNDYIASGAPLLRAPVCEWTNINATYTRFLSCLQETAVTREGRCHCVVLFSFQIPLPCRMQPSLAWNHARCLASDLGCTALPMLQTQSCDTMYALLQVQPDFPLVSRSESEINTVEQQIREVPDRCLLSSQPSHAITACYTQGASAPDPTLVKINILMCSCIMTTYFDMVPCAPWQPFALEELRCIAKEWDCYGVPLPLTKCASVAGTLLTNPSVAPCMAVDKILRKHTILDTCVALDHFRAFIPYICRYSSITSEDYQASLCRSAQLGCALTEIPMLKCTRFLNDKGHTIAFEAARRSRQLLASVAKECAPVFLMASHERTVASSCNGRCGDMLSELQNALLSGASSDNKWYVKYLVAACVRNNNLLPVFVALRTSHHQIQHIDVDTPIALGNVPHFIGRRVRGALLGSWPGPKGEVQMPTSPSANAMRSVCSAQYVRALGILAGYVLVDAQLELCSQMISSTTQRKMCAFEKHLWHDTIPAGVDAQCSSRCYNKVVQSVGKRAGPALESASKAALALTCKRDPLTSTLCMGAISANLAGVGGTVGTTFYDGTYPIKLCRHALAAFEQCRRGGDVHLCDCVRALSRAEPNSACLVHENVAPTTLCLLNNLFPCVHTEFKLAYSKYCTPSMALDMTCREHIWNPQMRCTESCIQRFHKYSETWGCCAGVYNAYLQTKGRGSLDNVANACKIQFGGTCPDTEYPDGFTGRIVIDADITVFRAYEAELIAAARYDVVTTLGLVDSNIVATAVGTVDIQFALKENEQTLSRDAITLQAAGGVFLSNETTQEVSIVFLVRGERRGEADTLRRDFQSFVTTGFPMGRLEEVYLKRAARNFLVSTHLSLVSTTVRPFNYFQKNITIGLDDTDTVAYELTPFDACGMLSPGMAVTLTLFVLLI